ncbi:brachyurin-like [Bacillus rossius redtenbacheri]|uniref:brachyurin-like n=1 Tax=Bacillus rossius redtenbacheri TaxID=93214 RepID=UPI002FDCB1BC
MLQKESVSPAGRIVNGAPASISQFPWQAQLVIDQSTFCGGSLIAAGWVLTAAHCSYEGSVFVVTLGATYLNSQEPGSVTTYAAAKAVHEQFDPNTLANDITLLQLQQAVSLSSVISPVGLPSQSQFSSSLEGQAVVISGWGKTSDDSDISQVLNYVPQTVISASECVAIYGSMMNSGKLCVTGSNLQSACHGDSGGPLVLQSGSVQVGIVSSGPPGGCLSGDPTLYTRVAAFLPWIARYVRQ